MPVQDLNLAVKTMVISILLLIAAALGVRWSLGSVASERIPTIRQDVDSLANVIDVYRERQGSYPMSLAELVANGFLDRLPSDFWGVPYNYQTEQPSIVGEDQPFYVWTLGADNLVGGEGADRDVGNW